MYTYEYMQWNVPIYLSIYLCTKAIDNQISA